MGGAGGWAWVGGGGARDAEAQCHPFWCGSAGGAGGSACAGGGGARNAQAQCNPFSCCSACEASASACAGGGCARNAQAQCNPFSCCEIAHGDIATNAVLASTRAPDHNICREPSPGEIDPDAPFRADPRLPRR